MYGMPDSDTLLLLNKYNLPLDGAIVSNKNYHIYPLGKSCRLPFEDRQSHAQFSLALLHLDLWGPAPISSNFGYRYYFSIVDDNTQFTWLYPLAKKSDVLTTFVHFKKLVDLALTLNNCKLMVEVNLPANYF